METEIKKMQEEYTKMANRLKKVQDDVLNEYFQTPAIIRFNYLQHLRPLISAVVSVAQLKIVIEKELARMKNCGREFTRIEQIEFRFCKKIYKDIVLGQGKEFEYGKDLTYPYDEQIITVDPITLGELDELEN